jgi:flagellar motor switch protein FliM
VKAIYDSSKLNVRSNLPRINLVPRESTLSGFSKQLQVLVGSAEISFSELSKMEIGDVVVLNKKIGQPFSIQNDSKLFLANGQLGKVTNKKAIQLIE